jgi:protein-L-isoaspartate(D-aspartate) O-methyltransferase
MVTALNFEQARFNMIEQQIRPWDVLDNATLQTVASIKREAFVPPAYRNMALSDLELPLTMNGVATGEIMFAPKMEARLLQELAPQARDSVAEIGAGSGYMAALLGARSAAVQSWEIRPHLAQFARSNLSAGGIANVTVHEGDGFTGLAAAAGEFDVILLSGAVVELPQTLLQKLRLGGRLAAIVGQSPVMSAVLVKRLDETQFDQVKLFETLVPALQGGPKPTRFRF